MDRRLQSSDAAEIAAYVAEHGLKSTGIGEWKGIVDGEKVTVRLVGKRTETAQNITVVINNIINGRKKKKDKGNDRSVGQAFADFSKKSRWF